MQWTDNSGKATQIIDISTVQLLFDTQLQPNGPKTICTREEHDGFVWSLDTVDLQENERIAHKFALNAFGYVQVSFIDFELSFLVAGCALDFRDGS